MDTIVRGFVEALNLIASLDPDIIEIVLLSLLISGFALAISMALGIPLGVLLGLREFPGRGLAVALVYTGMGLPPVVVGLAVFLMLSRQGPLGDWSWLFTPKAMITTQTILALPLVAGFTMISVAAIPPALTLQLRALGANPLAGYADLALRSA